MEAPRHRQHLEFLQVTPIQGTWGLLSTILPEKKLSGIPCKTWSIPSVQTKETEKRFYGKARKATSFLHSGKKKLLMLTLQNTWNNFFYLTAVSEVWLTDHFSSALLNPCISFNSALSYLYLVWRTGFSKGKDHAGHNSINNPLMCQAAVWFTSFFSVTDMECYHVNIQGKKTYTTGQKLMAQELKGQKDDEDWHPSNSSWAFNPQTSNRTTIGVDLLSPP